MQNTYSTTSTSGDNIIVTLILSITFFVIIYFMWKLSGWLINRKRPDAEKPKISPYKYERKDYIMTRYESEFFHKLEKAASAKYHIFPQIHLSSLLDNRVHNGQDWRAALSKIQRKSVDYVLVNKETMITTYAIELDDRSHDISVNRADRDAFVNEIFQDAGLPLIRFRNTNSMTIEDIIQKLHEHNI